SFFWSEEKCFRWDYLSNLLSSRSLCYNVCDRGDLFAKLPTDFITEWHPTGVKVEFNSCWQLNKKHKGLSMLPKMYHYCPLIEKLARLKQAKENAEKEIAEYRAQLEYEFQKKSSGDSGANVKRLELDTGAKIHHLKTEAGRISGDVVTMLLKYVTSVKN
ncbi:hypothetical protein V8G54_021914, partial [Vigna mungo]